MPPPPNLEITADEIHLWRVALSQSSRVLRRVERLLSPDEVHRADRFRSALHRERFIVGRGTLRIILARYLALAPEEIDFRYGGHGKPSLAVEGERRIQFNLAHSQDLAVVVIASGRLVGVDLEQVRPMGEADRIVSRFFSTCERSAFFEIAEEERLEAFFRGWTRKEAYMKAIGLGLSLPLDAFDVSISPSESPRLLRVSGNPDEPSRWSFRDFSDDAGYRGAVAVEGNGWRLRGYRLEPEVDEGCPRTSSLEP